MILPRLRNLACVLALFIAASGAAAAESLQAVLDRASRLAQQKQFERAEKVSRDAVARFPRSRDAQRMLANVLLWQGEYREARELFANLAAANGRDAEARVGLAQAYYWSGDYRNSLRGFERVLELQPANPEAQRAVTDIRSAMRAGYSVEASAIDDDQPYRGAGLTARAFFFTDPLTHFEVRGGGSQLRALALSRDTAQIGVAAETSFPALRLRVRGGVNRITFPDGVAQLLPSAHAERALGDTRLALTAERRALLRSATALRTHPTADAVTLRWSRENANRVRFALRGEHIRYFDRNRGWGADAYALIPLHRRLSIGGSVAYRDSQEPRFFAATSGPAAYDPYHTPHALAEARLIVAANVSPLPRLSASVHLDGGVARDRVIFANADGAFARTFHPWRVSAGAALQLSSDLALNVTASHETTAFYSANEVRAGVAGRF